ncbi:hypothetical protein D3C79_982380 [compost metagenome]
MQVLAGHAEQVALIVSMYPAVRFDQQETVDCALGGFQCHAATDQGVAFACPAVQPGDHLLLR